MDSMMVYLSSVELEAAMKNLDFWCCAGPDCGP